MFLTYALHRLNLTRVSSLYIKEGKRCRSDVPEREEKRVRDTAEPLEAREYVYELRQLMKMLVHATLQAEELDQPEKPLALARAEIGFNLNYLVWLLEQATEEAEETLRAAELVLAIEGVPLDN